MRPLRLLLSLLVMGIVCHPGFASPQEDTYSYNSISEATAQQIQQADAALALYQWETAETTLLNTLHGLPESGSDATKREIYLRLGMLYSASARYNESLVAFQQALKLSKESRQKKAESAALNGIGCVFIAIDQPENALPFFVQSLESGTVANPDRAQIRELQVVLEAKIRYLKKAKTLGSSSVEAGRNNTYTRPVTIPDRMPAFSPQVIKAEDFSAEDRVFEQRSSIMTGKVVGVRWEDPSTDALYGFGLVAKRLGLYEEARQIYSLVRERYQREGDTARVAMATNAEAVALFTLGRRSQALALYKDALAKAESAQDLHTVASLHNNIGLIQVELGDAAQSAKTLRQAVQSYRQYGDKQGEAFALNNLGFALEKQKKYPEAEKSYRDAIQIRETIRARLWNSPTTKSAYLQGGKSVYLNYLRVLLRQKKNEAAFDALQLYKARTVLESMNQEPTSLRNRLTDAEREQEAKLREQCNTLSRAMVAEGIRNEVGSRARFEELQKELQEAERTLATYSEELYARYPEVAANRTTHFASLSSLSTVLPPDTLLLEWVMMDVEGNSDAQDEPVLFLVVPHKDAPCTIKIIRLPATREELKQKITTLDRVIRSKQHLPYKAEAKSLYAALLKPVESVLPGRKRLLLCPDAELWQVPFAVLQNSLGKHLLESVEIGFDYSASGFLASHQQRERQRGEAAPDASHTILVAANPDLGNLARFRQKTEVVTPDRPITIPDRPITIPDRTTSTLSSLTGKNGKISGLPGAQQEANFLKQLFPNKAKILTGTAAQETEITDEVGKYRYVHIATHGFVNPVSPMLSSLLLATPSKAGKADGILTAREIVETNLSHVEMTVLSACDTAEGEKRSGEGIVGLTWALSVAGCPTQILSQWRVNDDSTAQLMRHFYTELTKGSTKSEALRRASLALLHDKKYSHPYYWAPFILVGDGR